MVQVLFARWIKPVNGIIWVVLSAAALLFLFSSARHALLQSGAFDLGIFDQAIYLISQGQTPISSYLGFHILGDHAAFVLYGLAGFYGIYPDVHWLFAIQALSLASGGWFTWLLARQSRLTDDQARNVALSYLLYPALFNANLFDFHPETIAVPVFIAAVWTARTRQLFPFISCLLLIVSCKAVLALPVIALGIWFLWIERKATYGYVSLVLGISWFLLTTQVIFPLFKSGTHAALNRYHYLGESIREIALNLIVQPHLILDRLFSWESLAYLILLVVPIMWGLSIRNLVYLLPAAPVVLLNLLSNYSLQRDLIHHYSLPVLPFLILAMIHTLRGRRPGINYRRWMLLWSVLCFLALAKYGYFWSRYLSATSTWTATQAAIAEVSSQGSVLTNENIAAHLSHRPYIRLLFQEDDRDSVSEFDDILLNSRHPDWGTSPADQERLVTYLSTSPHFHVHFQQDGVFLFKRNLIQSSEPTPPFTPDHQGSVAPENERDPTKPAAGH